MVRGSGWFSWWSRLQPASVRQAEACSTGLFSSDPRTPNRPRLLLPVEEDLRDVLRAARVVALEVEILHPRLVGNRILADGADDVVLLLAQVALDVEDGVLALPLIECH